MTNILSTQATQLAVLRVINLPVFYDNPVRNHVKPKRARLPRFANRFGEPSANFAEGTSEIPRVAEGLLESQTTLLAACGACVVYDSVYLWVPLALSALVCRVNIFFIILTFIFTFHYFFC